MSAVNVTDDMNALIGDFHFILNGVEALLALQINEDIEVREEAVRGFSNASCTALRELERIKDVLEKAT